MKYHLDTNVLSALMRGNAAVNARFAAVAASAVAVSGPALAEVAYGITRLPESKRKQWLQAKYASIAAAVARSEWTDDVTAAYGAVKASLERRGELIGDFDTAIAAHAVAERAILVTADTRHMARVQGLTIEDWSKE